MFCRLSRCGCLLLLRLRHYNTQIFVYRPAAPPPPPSPPHLFWCHLSSSSVSAPADDALQARARDEAKRSNRPFSAKKRPTLGPRVTPDADGKSSPAGGGSNGAHAAAAAAGSEPAVAEAAAGGGRVRGRGSVQAPGVPGSQGGVLAANMEAEVGRGHRQAAAAAVQHGRQEEKEEEEPIILDDLFRKTDAKPSLYWLPLSEEEVRGRMRMRGRDGRVCIFLARNGRPKMVEECINSFSSRILVVFYYVRDPSSPTGSLSQGPQLALSGTVVKGAY